MNAASFFLSCVLPFSAVAAAAAAAATRSHTVYWNIKHKSWRFYHLLSHILGLNAIFSSVLRLDLAFSPFFFFLELPFIGAYSSPLPLPVPSPSTPPSLPFDWRCLLPRFTLFLSHLFFSYFFFVLNYSNCFFAFLFFIFFCEREINICREKIFAWMLLNRKFNKVNFKIRPSPKKKRQIHHDVKKKEKDE